MNNIKPENSAPKKSRFVNTEGDLKDKKTVKAEERLVDDRDMLFELGKVYYYNCDLKKAEHYMQLAKFESQHPDHRLDSGRQSLERVLEINNILMRISAERCDLDKHASYQEESRKLLENGAVEQLLSQYYYQVALLHYYKKEFNEAFVNFTHALEHAEVREQKNEEAHALYGLSGCYLEFGDFGKATERLKEAERLAVEVSDRDLLVTIHIFKGLHYTSQGDYDLGFSEFDHAQRIIRNRKNWYLSYIVMYHVALATRRQGKLERARERFEFLMEQIAQTDLNQLKQKVDFELELLGRNQSDLIIDTRNRQIFVRSKGKVALKNCHILIDILLLFVKKAGKTVTKEELANRIWHEDYNPLNHDNKIYYNINRLRRLIEDKQQIGGKKYIVTSKNGYHLNTEVRVEIKEDQRCSSAASV